MPGKSTVQDNTLSCYELGRVQDFLGRRLQGCLFLRICEIMYSNCTRAHSLLVGWRPSLGCLFSSPFPVLCFCICNINKCFVDESGVHRLICTSTDSTGRVARCGKRNDHIVVSTTFQSSNTRLRHFGQKLTLRINGWRPLLLG